MTIIVPLHKPSSTIASVYANILSTSEKHLVLAKSDCIEIYQVTESGLELVETAPLYGHITQLYAFRPPNSPKDVLALTTEERTVVVLNYDTLMQCFNCIASIRLSPYDPRIDAVDATPIILFDAPTMTLFVHAYHGKISLIKFDPEVFDPTKTIPTQSEGITLLSSRLQHESIRDKIDITNEVFTFANIDSICIIPQSSTAPAVTNINRRKRFFLPSLKSSPTTVPPPPPALAILFRDNMYDKHVGISIAGEPHHDIYLRPTLSKVDRGAEHILAIPEPIGGFLILGETKLEYVKVKNVAKVRDAKVGDGRRKRKPSQGASGRGGRRKLTSEESHDMPEGSNEAEPQKDEGEEDDGEFHVMTQEFPLAEPTVFACYVVIDEKRILLSSESGQLSLVMITSSSYTNHISLTHHSVGNIPAPTSLVHISANVFFATSHYSSSVLFTLLDEHPFIEIIQEFPNLAPLSDFVILPNECSTPSVVACTGGYESGALRKIEFGTNVDVLVYLEDLPEVDNIWNLDDNIIALTQANGANNNNTRVFEYKPDGSLAELDHYKTLDMNTKSLFVGYFQRSGKQYGELVQVTSSFVQSSDGTCWDAVEKSISTAVIDCNFLSVCYDSNKVAIFKDTLVEPLLTGWRGSSSDSPVTSEICDMAFTYHLNQGLGALVAWECGEVQIFGIQAKYSEAQGDFFEHKIVYFPDLITDLREKPRSLRIVSNKNRNNKSYQIIIGHLNGSISYCTLIPENNGYKATQIYGPFKLGIEPVTFSEVNSRVYAIGDNVHQLSLMDGRADQSYTQTTTPIRDIFASLLNLKDVACMAEMSVRQSGTEKKSTLGFAGTGAGLVLFNLSPQDSCFHTMNLQLKERVRRIVDLPALELLALITVEKRLSLDGVESLHSFVKVVNKFTFEILDTYPLGDNEIGECLLNLSYREFENYKRAQELMDKRDIAKPNGIGFQIDELQKIKEQAFHEREVSDDFLLVGTGVDKGSDDVTMGNLKVLQIDHQGKISERSSLTVKGAVYSMSQIGGDSFVFSVNSLVQTAEISGDGTYKINILTPKESAFVSPTVALALAASDTQLLVGDMMQGTKFLRRDSPNEIFKPVSGGCKNQSVWVTSVALFYNNSEYYVGDADGNFYICSFNMPQIRSIMLPGIVNRIRTIEGHWQPPVHSTYPLDYDWNDLGLFNRPIVACVEPRAVVSTTSGGLYLSCHISDPALNWVLYRLQLSVIKHTWALNTLGLAADSQVMIYQEFCNEKANIDDTSGIDVDDENRVFRRGTAQNDDIMIDGAILLRFLELDVVVQEDIVVEVLKEIELHESQTTLPSDSWRLFYTKVRNNQWNTKTVSDVLTTLHNLWK